MIVNLKVTDFAYGLRSVPKVTNGQEQTKQHRVEELGLVMITQQETVFVY